MSPVIEQLIEIVTGAAQEVHTVAHVLNGRVDFVGDAGGKPTHGLQFLCQLEFNDHALTFLHFLHELVLQLLFLLGLLAFDRDVGTHCHRMRQAPRVVVYGTNRRTQPVGGAVAPSDFILMVIGAAGAHGGFDIR